MMTMGVGFRRVGAAEQERTVPLEGRLLLLSAEDPQALDARIDACRRLHPADAHALADIAYTLERGRKAFSHRAAMVIPQHVPLGDALGAPDGLAVIKGKAKPEPASVGVMFPGQGSQFIGMGAQLYELQPRFRELFDRCDTILRPLLELSLRELLFSTDAERSQENANTLTRTAVAQPALFVIEYALGRLLLDYGLRPALLMGHSVGEFPAACLAGVFELEAALRLVAERGRLMQSMPPGSMLAVLAELSEVMELCGHGVDVAANNAPGLVVVAGPTPSIEEFDRRAQGLGLDTRALHTSHAFHSCMMDPILEDFMRAVERAAPQAPRYPMISTMTGARLSDEEAMSPDYWAQQLRNPVRFADAIATACDDSARVLLEVGPGVALTTSAAKQMGVAIRPRKILETLGHPKAATPALDATLRSLGQLWIQNAELDWDAIYSGPSRKLVRLPCYPFTRKRHWISPPCTPKGDTNTGSRGATAVAAQPRVPDESTADGAPGEDTQALASGKLRALLESRLGASLEADDLGRAFLELGFDSLALSQLAGKLRQEFGVRVPVRQLFEDLKTPEELAAHLAKEGKLTTPAVRQPPHTALGARAAGGLNGSPASVAGRQAPAETSEMLARLERIEALLDKIAARVPAQSAVETRPGRPLTASQREIWLAVRVAGDAANRGYNECRAFHFQGALDRSALLDCVQELGRRHEALRHVFTADGERCITKPKVKLPVYEHDLRSVADDDRHQRLQQLFQEQVALTFDLSRGPLLRGSLVRVQDDESWLVLCAHHVVVDGSSWEILIRELAELYSARAEGRAAVLGPPGSFGEYADNEAQYAASEEMQQAEAFWLDQLDGQIEDLSLPTDRPRPPRRTFNATRRDHQLPAQLMDRVRAVSKQAGCTPQTFLLAAFQVLLYRLSHQLDLVVGIPTSGQAAAGVESLVGHCVHVLPLRTLIDPNKNLQEHLQSLHGNMLDSLEHQRATFTELLHKLDRPRDTSRPALIQVAFGMGRSQKFPEFAGLQTTLSVIPRVSEIFELYVYATENAKGLEISWSYNTELFSEQTIRLWQRCYATLIEALLVSPQSHTFADAPVLGNDDRERLLEMARGKALPRPRHIPVHWAIARQAAERGEQVAVVDQAGSHSYAELNTHANQVGHWLLTQALTPNSLVAVCLDRSVELVAVLLGVWRAGLGYVPLDPAYPRQRVQAILEDSDASIVLTSNALKDRIPQGVAATCLEELPLESFEGTPPELQASPQDTAYVIFTSGSTGRPKGVQIPQRAVENFIGAMARAPGFGASDRLLAITTISFDISVLELFLPLVAGGRVTIATRDQALNPREVERLLRENEITVMQATPATWQMLFDGGWKGDPKLKVLCGGEALPKHLAERFLSTCGEIWNVYGPTETTVWSSVKQIVDANDLTIGKPIDNTTFYILDAGRRLVPCGAHGELWIGGAGVAVGYLGRPELTDERFVQSPFDPADRLYRTGDLARLRADGEFECLGRVDFQVKIRGFRIELGEIETAILSQPSVAAGVVIAREDRPGEKRLVAYLVPDAGATIDVDQIREALGQTLPPYMVPAAYCVLTTLPMTPNNKVDRKQLPAPQAMSTEVARPGDALEAELQGIWAELLGDPELGIRENFYAAGGHSLLALRLIDQINERLGTELSVNDLFSSPTIEGLAAALRPVLPSREAGDPRVQLPRSVAAGVRGPQRANVHSGLFVLREGTDARVPLLLVHGDKGNGLLLPELPPELRVYGYHHQGSDGERLQLRSVEALAARVHEELLEAQGSGPVALAGHSFGALVAFHVGVLREREGLQTPCTILIDARHPDALDSSLPSKSPRGLKRFLQARLLLRGQVRIIREAEAYVDRGEAVPVDKRTAYILATYQLATDRYRPPTWPGHLEVIRSREWVEASPEDRWERAVVGQLRRVVIEGTHLEIVRSPEGVARVAKRINEILDEIDGSRG